MVVFKYMFYEPKITTCQTSKKRSSQVHGRSLIFTFVWQQIASTFERANGFRVFISKFMIIRQSFGEKDAEKIPKRLYQQSTEKASP